MVLDDPAVHAELADLAARYETALGDNDLATLDAMFWASAQTIRYGVGENLHGIEEIREFRRLRPGGSPPREVLRTTIVALGPDCGVINVEFRRIGGGPIGRQSQTWARLPEGWRIVAAHVSLTGNSH